MAAVSFTMAKTVLRSTPSRTTATPKNVSNKKSASRSPKQKKTSPAALASQVPILPRALEPLQGQLPLEERRAAGKLLRNRVPREAHAAFSRPANFPGAVEIVMQTNEGRLEHLIPLRLARMCCSPFAFYRGAAAVQAHDVAQSPVTGVNAMIDGDAHVNNFGLYGTPQREVVFDLNDFDETIVGPWEWDLKRLVASVNLAARENGFTRRERDIAVRRCVSGYRTNINSLQSLGVLETWYLHVYPGRENLLAHPDAQASRIIAKAVAKAAAQTNQTLLQKVADKQKDGTWRFHENPPLQTRVDSKTKQAVADALQNYASTLSQERQFMFHKYRLADVAHRVVGVGSVGTRAYLALLFGNGDNDPLFLQVKEAIVPALHSFSPVLRDEFAHQGKRVVTGQRALQAGSDVMLGWTKIGSIPFYVRQMKNMKGSIPVEWLTGSSFNFYAWACGALLSRAHARTTDAAIIAGYIGKSSALDDALILWAEAYAEQTILDFAALVKAVSGDRRVQALIKSAQAE
jgi:uncharacterized protein (DUF2252 family)